MVGGFNAACKTDSRRGVLHSSTSYEGPLCLVTRDSLAAEPSVQKRMPSREGILIYIAIYLLLSSFTDEIVSDDIVGVFRLANNEPTRTGQALELDQASELADDICGTRVLGD